MLNASLCAVRTSARLAEFHTFAVCAAVFVIVVVQEEHAARYRERQ